MTCLIILTTVEQISFASTEHQSPFFFKGSLFYYFEFYCFNILDQRMKVKLVQKLRKQHTERINNLMVHVS